MMGWRCDAAFCPGTHGGPEDRCNVRDGGGWFCGRLQPPCPGHEKPKQRCGGGTIWHCGAILCDTHTGYKDRCPSGRWMCGALGCPRNHRLSQGIAGSSIEGCKQAGCGAGEARIVPHYYETGLQYLDRIVKVLRSPEARRINFTLNGVRVYGQGFETVAQILEKGKLKIRPGRSLPADASMRYDPESKFLEFSGAPRPFFDSLDTKIAAKMGIIHEAVHVLAHYNKLSVLTENDEAAAYVACQLYSFYKGANTLAFVTRFRSRLLRTETALLARCSTGGEMNVCDQLYKIYAFLIAGDLYQMRLPRASDVRGLRDTLCTLTLYHRHCGVPRQYGTWPSI